MSLVIQNEQKPHMFNIQQLVSFLNILNSLKK